MSDFLGARVPRDIFHKYIFERSGDKYSTFAGPHKINLNGPHRPRRQQPGGQTVLHTPALGAGRATVIIKDTFACQHWPCNRQVSLPSGIRVEDTGGWCPHCNGLICAACLRLGTCLPIEEGIFRYEELAKIKERMSADEMIRDMRLREVGL